LSTLANNGQVAPILTSVQCFSGSTPVTGTLNSNSNQTFTIQFFKTDAYDSSGAGEGQAFLGSTTTTTNAGGNANFTATLPTDVSVTQVVTATATDPANNTSAFSLCRSVSVFNVSGRVVDESGNSLNGVGMILNGPTSANGTTGAN